MFAPDAAPPISANENASEEASYSLCAEQLAEEGDTVMLTWMSNVFKAYGGSILLGLAAFLLFGGVIFLFLTLVRMIPSATGDLATALLPLLVIGGVIVLIFMLTIVAIIFKILDLTDPKQAMGLPEGSIRAVIALSLIVLFAILAVFLYQGIKNGESTESKDFAKLLLTLLGTLMTAITSFYLGAGTATSAVTAGKGAAKVVQGPQEQVVRGAQEQEAVKEGGRGGNS